MFIKLKGNDTELTASSLVEQKLFKQGEAVGWLLSIYLKYDGSASELDSMLTEESLSEITLVGDSEKQTVFSGYDKMTSCIIRHMTEGSTAEIQLTKGV